MVPPPGPRAGVFFVPAPAPAAAVAAAHRAAAAAAAAASAAPNRELPPPPPRRHFHRDVCHPLGGHYDVVHELSRVSSFRK